MGKNTVKVDRIAVFRSASDLKECACCAVQRVTVVMLRCCVCAECCWLLLAAVAGWALCGIAKVNNPV